VDAAQAALDARVATYNADRPHQSLDAAAPVTPADRFTLVPQAQRDLIELWLPPALTPAHTTQGPPAPTDTATAPGRWAGGPVEFDRAVPQTCEWPDGSSGSAPRGPGW
jgi:hypothetical protein